MEPVPVCAGTGFCAIALQAAAVLAQAAIAVQRIGEENFPPIRLS